MSNPLSIAQDWALANWSSRAAGPVAAVAAAASLCPLVFGGDILAYSWPEVASCAVVALVVQIIWFRSNRSDKHTRGKVGISIALRYENSAQANLMSSELVESIRRLASNRDSESNFSVLELPGRLVPAKKTEEWARAIARRSRSHYLVYGQVTEREVRGDKVHSLLLDGYVAHRPISEDVSRGLSQEFRNLLPRHFVISKDGDIFGLQLAGRYMHEVAEFIVGMAAGLSGDFVYSATLLRGLRTKLSGRSPEVLGPMQQVRNEISDRLAWALEGRIRQKYFEYWKSGNVEPLREVEPIADELLTVDPSHYRGKLIKAICQFELHRDIHGASAALESCSPISDSTWKYSLAFLRAYAGDLDEAYRYYLKAFDSPSGDATVPIQTEEFIHRLLQVEPEKKHLYFCLGLINYKGKGDLAAAKLDFERFLDSTTPEGFPMQHEAVAKWLRKIEGALDRAGSGV